MSFSVHRRPMKVERVEVVTADIDHNYARVELSIDGVEFEFSGPDAQVVGSTLNTAGGGDMFERSKREDDLERRLDVMREAAARLKPLARHAMRGSESARTELDEAIVWLMKGCPQVEEEG
jgi:hypothetical protein